MPRRVRVATLLDVGAPVVMAALQQVETLAEVTRGALAVRAARGTLPTLWPSDGTPVELVVRPLHLPPGWHHTIRVVELDTAGGVLRSEEHGGPLRRWEHTIRVQPVHPDRCRYVDDVLLDAGALTPVAAVLTEAFYRWRQLRWRRLARRLADQRTTPG